MAPILTLTNISKSFPGVKALDRISLKIESGEVHALVGENGAGKSTLIKIVSGVYAPDSGDMQLSGRPFRPPDAYSALGAGIATVHQELSVSQNVSVAQNIFVGREPVNGFGIIQWYRLFHMAQAYLDELGINVSARVRVSSLTIAERQLVEIAKALSLNARVLILDEPTSSLSGEETARLFKIIRDLRTRGVTVIYISHKLEEVFAISDRISVLRDGHLIQTVETQDANSSSIIRLMVGREISDLYPPKGSPSKLPILEVRGLTCKGKFNSVDLTLFEGEILGLAGLVGAGRTDLAKAIFGANRVESGEVILAGRKVSIKSPTDAIANGIVYLPEDRKQEGLFPSLSVTHNIVVTVLRRLVRSGLIRWGQADTVAREYVSRFRIKAPSLRTPIKALSGGNQQKVLLARALANNTKVLIVDEPTRGIDVGAKAEVHTLLRQLAEKGVSIIMISSELPEILGMSDRIYVMHGGQVRGILSLDEASEQAIMSLCYLNRVAC